jgi:hypothetical protein
MLAMLNLSQHVQHAQAHRAVAYAITAAGAENLAELFWIDGKLVQNALPLTRRLKCSRVVSGSMKRKNRELACVPGSDAGVTGNRSGIDDVEAVARGTGECTNSASHAASPVFGPERIFKVAVDESSNLTGVKLGFGGRRGLARFR